MRVGILIPHFFMHNEIFHDVIFSPGDLAINFANELEKSGVEVTFFSPSFTHPNSKIKNVNCELKNFEEELVLRGESYIELFKKHPLVFISLARQAQSELVAKAYKMANQNKLDLIHVYACEEEIPIVFAEFCKKPIVFTHHEPFNYQVKYRNIFPKYKHLNWLSISFSQRKSMPQDTNFIANIYHGIDINRFKFNPYPKGDYFAYFGRIIKSKGVHLAIKLAKKTGINLKIAGKHYSGFGKEDYWEKFIEPAIDGKNIEYVGFLNNDYEKEKFLGNAKGLIMPSIWEEPFGLVAIEAMSCGTPILGLDSGAIPEIVQNGVNGFIVKKVFNSDGNLDEETVVSELAKKLAKLTTIKRSQVRKYFVKRFTLKRMTQEHIKIYKTLISSQNS